MNCRMVWAGCLCILSLGSLANAAFYTGPVNSATVYGTYSQHTGGTVSHDPVGLSQQSVAGASGAFSAAGASPFSVAVNVTGFEIYNPPTPNVANVSWADATSLFTGLAIIPADPQYQGSLTAFTPAYLRVNVDVTRATDNMFTDLLPSRAIATWGISVSVGSTPADIGGGLGGMSSQAYQEYGGKLVGSYTIDSYLALNLYQPFSISLYADSYVEIQNPGEAVSTVRLSITNPDILILPKGPNGERLYQVVQITEPWSPPPALPAIIPPGYQFPAFSYRAISVPEPSTLVLAVFGGLAVVVAALKRRLRPNNLANA